MCPCSPDAADSSSFDVQLGDIILTATDGLFDNMPDYMILQELKKLKVCDGVVQTGLSLTSSDPPARSVVLKNTNYESIQQTAQSIAEQAHVLAYDPNYMSPFAQFACDNGLNVRGERLRVVEPEDRQCWIPVPHQPDRTFSSLSRRKARRHHSLAVHSGGIYRLESVCRLHG